MRTLAAGALLAASASALFAARPTKSTALPTAAPLTGYAPAASAAERAIEARFRALPTPDRERQWHRLFTAQPHPAGSERNHQLAETVASEWRRQGWHDVRILQYDVLTSLPRAVSLEMIAPVSYRATLREAAYPDDPDTANPAVRGAYLSMSASGDVTAPLVYAHSGNPDDYAELKRHGIDVKGKIVLVRYSNPYSYRGFKALTAQNQGAAALIIYSDPAEDGYRRGPVFPTGPWGPETHIQRGSITYDFLVPGDPLTPGWASVPGARRLAPSEAVSLPHIIAIPLSWHDAQPLLAHLDGPAAPPSWQGGLPLTYRMGGSAVRLHLHVDMDTRPMPNYVVEARLPGAEHPGDIVLIGNHRDAWEFGGVDPSSGTASLMEVTRALGSLAASGFRPRRTIVAANWDGEEVGLTGSTEYGEQFADDLRKNLVAYINVDSSTSGPEFHPSAVGSLAPLITSLAGEFPVINSAPHHGTLVETKIGSGSDFTVFLNFLCRPVVELQFDGPYGVYHSVYDDFYWMNHFGDPGYKYHTLMSQLWGSLALRLAQADVLPFDFASYGDAIASFLAGVAHSNPPVDLAALNRSIAAFRASGDSLNRALAAALARGPLPSGTASRVNSNLMRVESNWAIPSGIPGRPWFKHMLYAARYTYAPLQLPGLTEAVEKQDWKTARAQAVILRQAIDRNTGLLNQTRKLLP